MRFMVPPEHVSLRQRWDDICTQCGACCYQRDRDEVSGELVINKKAPCRFLDTDSQLCTTYDTRLKACAECKQVTVFHALFSRYLPDDCGYVSTFRIWRRPSTASLPNQRRIRGRRSTPGARSEPSR